MKVTELLGFELNPCVSLLIVHTFWLGEQKLF